MKKRITLATIRVAGVRHHTTKKQLHRIDPKTAPPIVLSPQPDNPVDPLNAVECFLSGAKLGYVPHAISGIIRALLEAGYDIRGKIEDVYPEDKTVIMKISLHRSTKSTPTAQD